MSYHLCQLMKAGKIVKFSTNENRAMSVASLANDGSEVKHKITYTSSGKGNLLVTMTNQENDDAINRFRKMKKK